MDPTEDAPQGGTSLRHRRRPGSGGRPPADVRQIDLGDGVRIWVRPIRPEDRERIVHGLSMLSARSRYMRFHSYVDHLSRSQLDYLVDVDHVNHEALVALDPDIEDQPGVAIARYIRLSEDPTIAEAAITVLDDYQGIGIGTALIGLLERAAHEHGIRSFRNYVLAENEAMLEIFRQLSGRVEAEGPGLYRVDVPVPGPAEDQPDTPAGRWVALVGRDRVPEDEGWSPFMWLRRRVAELDEAVKPRSRLLKGLLDGDDGASGADRA